MKKILYLTCLLSAGLLFTACSKSNNEDQATAIKTFNSTDSKILPDGTTFKDVILLTTGLYKEEVVLCSCNLTFSHEKTSGGSSTSGSFQQNLSDSPYLFKFTGNVVKVPVLNSSLDSSKDNFIEITTHSNRSVSYRYELWYTSPAFGQITGTGAIQPK